MIKDILTVLLVLVLLSGSHYYVYDKGVDRGIEVLMPELVRATSLVQRLLSMVIGAPGMADDIAIEWVDDGDYVTFEEPGDVNYGGGEKRLHREALTP